MFDIADIWATRTGNQVRLVSANDHIHTRNSAHYAGLALDLLSSRPDDLARLFREIGYRVLWRVPGHFGHIHVQESTRPLVPDTVDARDPTSASAPRAVMTAGEGPSPKALAGTARTRTAVKRLARPAPSAPSVTTGGSPSADVAFASDTP